MLRASGSARRGGDVLRESIGAMSAIETSSRQIGQIVDIGIDEIAFRPIFSRSTPASRRRAARGRPRFRRGRLEEVRLLAQRSLQAAKEDRQLVSTAQTQGKRGVSLVNETSGALTEVAELTAASDALVAQVAAAAKEQAASLGGVCLAIGEIDRATRENAAIATRSSDASADPARTHELIDLVAACGWRRRGTRARREAGVR